jgi:hypothetical protein
LLHLKLYYFIHVYFLTDDALQHCSLVAKHTAFVTFFGLLAALTITSTCLGAMMGTNDTDIYG